jgi:hypothetical protein
VYLPFVAAFSRSSLRFLGSERLWLTSAAGDLVADSFACARVAEIGLFCAAARVGERYALYGALSFINLGTTVVADKHGLSSHYILHEIAFL